MSQENVEVVRRFFDALNARDEAAWLDLVHPDAELTPDAVWAQGALPSQNDV